MHNLLLIAALTFGLASCGNHTTNTADKPTPPAGDPSLQNNATLETVFVDSTYQLTGVAKSADGRLFVNYPYWLDNHSYSVIEVKQGKPVPYPDEKWNSFKNGEDGLHKFVCVQAVVADDKGYLWVVDPAGIGLGKVYRNSSKLIKIHLATNQVERIFRFPSDVVNEHTYINDIRVDNTHGYAYMTSSSNGGIVVLNIQTGESRFVLHNSPTVLSDTSYHFSPNGSELTNADGKAVKVNSDGIALSPDKKWLYYKPLTDDKLYRISTQLLRDFKTSLATLADSVQDLGHFTTTDGMEFDQHGNLYLGDLERYSIVKITPDGNRQTIARDSTLLSWPDSYSIGTDGYLYVSSSQIQLMPWFHKGRNQTRYPYRIVRMKL